MHIIIHYIQYNHHKVTIVFYTVLMLNYKTYKLKVRKEERLKVITIRTSTGS